MIRTATIGKSNQKAQRMVNKFFKSNELRVKERFLPVTSEHVVNLTPAERVRLSLDEDSFVYVKEVKNDKGWTVKDAYTASGSSAMVEKSFIDAVKNIVNILNK